MNYRIARIGLHNFEEPCITGSHGSGTIFFSGCDMRCSFCQNYEISRGGKGLNVTEEQLLRAMEYLESEGAENINLVTPSPWIKSLQSTLKIAKQRVKVPIVWNSNGYEIAGELKKLEGSVDVYLPDFKYGDDFLGEKYSGIKNYRLRAIEAIREMRRQRPNDVFDENGKLKEGVIVRHLVLPDAIENTREALKSIAEIDKEMYVSLMSQYFPASTVANDPILGRRITEREYDEAIEAFFSAGLKNGFSQELDSAVEDYVPDFDIDALKELVKTLIDK